MVRPSAGRGGEGSGDSGERRTSSRRDEKSRRWTAGSRRVAGVSLHRSSGRVAGEEGTRRCNPALVAESYVGHDHGLPPLVVRRRWRPVAWPLTWVACGAVRCSGRIGPQGAMPSVRTLDIRRLRIKGSDRIRATSCAERSRGQRSVRRMSRRWPRDPACLGRYVRDARVPTCPGPSPPSAVAVSRQAPGRSRRAGGFEAPDLAVGRRSTFDQPRSTSHVRQGAGVSVHEVRA